MTDKGKDKLITAVVSIALTAALSIPTTLIAARVNKPSVNNNNIILPNGQQINLEEYNELVANYQNVKEELQALKEGQATLINAPPETQEQTTASPETQAPTTTTSSTTQASDMQYLIDVVPAKEWKAGRYFTYSSQDSGDTEFFIMDGKPYYNGCTWNGYVGSYSIHMLNKNYTEISGTLGHVIEGHNSGSHLLRIYYDGVPKKEVQLTMDTNRPLVLDVTGVRELKFEVTSGNSNTFGYGNVTIK